MNLPELLYLVTLLFLQMMLLSRNLFLKKIGILTIIYLLRMLSWLHLVHQLLLLINLVVFANTVKKPGHDISECYRKQKDDKRKHHQSCGILPRSHAATISSTPVDDPVVTVSQLESMFHRYMSQPSPVLSVTSGNKSWLLDSACCNHMTPHASHFSQKTPLSPSPIIYTADSSHMSVSHMALSLLLI